jgi:hypothetical protein
VPWWSYTGDVNTDALLAFGQNILDFSKYPIFVRVENRPAREFTGLKSLGTVVPSLGAVLDNSTVRNFMSPEAKLWLGDKDKVAQLNEKFSRHEGVPGYLERQAAAGNAAGAEDLVAKPLEGFPGKLLDSKLDFFIRNEIGRRTKGTKNLLICARPQLTRIHSG